VKLLVLLCAAAPAFAQVTSMPPQVQQRLAEVGPVWGKDIGGNIEKTLEVYTPLLAVAPKQGVTVQRDLTYGPDPRHRADIFRADGLKNAPVVVFLHGGAYVRGDRDVNAEIYSNVPMYFARRRRIGRRQRRT
jgi:acetyl esterase